MSTTRKEIISHVNQMNAMPHLDQENTILASQVQNMAKERVLEAGMLFVPVAVARRLIAPRLGFTKLSLVPGLLIDSVLPLSYYTYQSKEDREKYTRMLGIESKEAIDKETRERRARFITQFWSNSQYWH